MRIKLTISFLAGAVYVLTATQAMAIDQWPDTGQTLCYDDAGTVIACGSAAYPGQDADTHPIPDPAQNTTDNGNGTVTDNVTGLMWVQDGGVSGAVDLDGANTFIATNLNGTSFAGYTDWRLPTVLELSTLVNAGFLYNPDDNREYGDLRLAAQYVPYYWTQTADANGGAGSRMMVRFDVGRVRGSSLDGVTNAHVLAVRP